MERLPQYYRCGECEMVPASVDCRDCSESYCADCYQAAHAKGKRATHENNRRIFVCQRCNAAPAVFACGDDGKVYCDRCNTRLHGPKGKHRKNAASVKPVAEYFATAGGKAPAVDKDEENGLGLKVNALVASPARFSRTAAAVADTMHDAEAAAEEPADASAGGGAATGDSDPLSSDQARDEDAASDPKPGEPGAGVKFTDSETEKLLVGGEIVAERIWGWRRLSRLFPEGAIFETGNKSLRTKCACSAPEFPDVHDPAVAEATGQAPGAEDAGVHKQVESLPRFPHRPASIALDERGLNLAVLAVALAGSSAPLARLFHSFEYRKTGYYSLQFFEPFTRAERIRNAAASAGMPLTEQSPARQRGPCAVSEPRASRGGVSKADEEALSPRRQHEALVAETGAEGVPTLAFLRDVFDKVSVPVAVDDLVPTGKDGKPIFGLTDQAGELWRLMLGKGYAKYAGSYAALEQANPVEALRTLTGARVTAESWGGCGECLDLFPDLEAAARFVWWRVDAAKRLGQLCWFTHSRETVGDGQGADGDGEFSPDRFRDLDDAEAAAADDAAGNGSVEVVTPAGPSVDEAAPSEQPHAALQDTPHDAVLPTAAAIGDEHSGPFSLPAEWGCEAWATRQGESAEVVDAAVAIHTAEMSLRVANNAGIRRDTLAAPPSADGWQLVKLNQLGGDLGAERFSYAHFSGQWTKELRERFDFKASDSDVVMGTAEDLAESFDTVTCCSGYVGAPPSVNLVLRPHQSATASASGASRVLVVLRPGVAQLSVTNAAAFDLRRARPVAATAVLQLALHSVSASSGESFLTLPTSFDSPEAVAAAVSVPPVMAVNVALGLSDRVPDQFLVRGLCGDSAPEGSDIGLAFVLTVAQSYHTDALSIALGFKYSEVAFVRLLDDDQ